MLVDDVITAGTAIRESMEIIQAQGAQLAGVLISLDPVSYTHLSYFILRIGVTLYSSPFSSTTNKSHHCANAVLRSLKYWWRL